MNSKFGFIIKHESWVTFVKYIYIKGWCSLQSTSVLRGPTQDGQEVDSPRRHNVELYCSEPGQRCPPNYHPSGRTIVGQKAEEDCGQQQQGQDQRAARQSPCGPQEGIPGPAGSEALKPLPTNRQRLGPFQGRQKEKRDILPTA